jgi:hypothetical protein
MSTVKGIVGGIIGGIIASIPWILLAVYLNIIVAYLAFLIGLGVNYGYRLLGGKVNKALPFIVAIVSVAIIIIVTAAVIPLFQLWKDGFGFDLYYLNILYRNSQFVNEVLMNTGIGVVFTFLGIYGLLKNISHETKVNAFAGNMNEETVIDIDVNEE